MTHEILEANTIALHKFHTGYAHEFGRRWENDGYTERFKKDDIKKLAAAYKVSLI